MKRISYIFMFAGLLFAAASNAPGQAPQKIRLVPEGQAIRSSPAFAELALRRAEIESELESLLLEFTEEYPKVAAARHSLAQLQKQIDGLMVTKTADTGRLTLALGKLLVKKVELETDLWSLQQTLADGHPDVKRSKRKLEIFDKAIKDILG